MDLDAIEETLTACVRYQDVEKLWSLLKKFPITVTTPAGRLHYEPREQRWRQILDL